jgi:hypothetical protein
MLPIADPDSSGGEYGNGDKKRPQSEAKWRRMRDTCRKVGRHFTRLSRSAGNGKHSPQELRDKSPRHVDGLPPMRPARTKESGDLPRQWLHDILNRMTTPQLRSMLQAAPFRPFEIYLADGRALSVPHPEMVAITSGGRTIGVATSDDTIEIVDLLLVTSLKPHANGASK